MTHTPELSVFSRKQQNKSLSAKKKPQKTLRNILSTKTCNWSILEDPTEFAAELKSLNLRKSSNKKSTSDQSPESSAMEVDSNSAPGSRKIILFGVSEVARCLKNDECCALIFDAVVPKILVQHLVQMAESKFIPIVAIAGLKEIILTIFGFKSSTMCFKTEPSNSFSKILPLLKCYFTRDRLPSDEVLKNEENIQTTANDVVENISQEPKRANTGIIYLHRKNKNERVFIPPPVSVFPEPSEKVGTSVDYIEINEINLKSLNNNQSKYKKFKPLVIHKIQNNVTRPKKKNTK